MSGPVLLILRAVLAASLYAFLGMAFYLIWRDLREQARMSTSRQSQTITLRRQIGDDALSLSFTLAEIVIGRDPACDFILEDSTVSAQHTRLLFRQGHWWVEDLRSTNGTFLNQEPVTSPLVITTGDDLRCGQATLTISLGESI
jgi:pSer/pThr/pTyr-binding forkhead associated (FHA) protein